MLLELTMKISSSEYQTFYTSIYNEIKIEFNVLFAYNKQEKHSNWTGKKDINFALFVWYMITIKVGDF